MHLPEAERFNKPGSEAQRSTAKVSVIAISDQAQRAPRLPPTFL